MRLATIKELKALKPVLKNPQINHPDPVYWVFSDITDSSWANTTIIVPEKLGQEFPKTFGHYHPDGAVDETYHLIEGEGVLQMQRKHFENGIMVPEKVEDVYLIVANPGDEIVITPEFGHSWSNVGRVPLISFDDWRSGHTRADYEVMEKMHGMGYYLIESMHASDEDFEYGGIKAIPNPKYIDLPKPIWLSANEFANLPV